MFVEVRPPCRRRIAPDPKRPPGFIFTTDVPAFVVLELASHPSLFEDAGAANRDTGLYARITSTAAQACPPVRCKRGVQVKTINAKYAYLMDTDTWQPLATTSASTTRDGVGRSTDDESGHVVFAAAATQINQAQFYAWAPFVEILRDQVIYFYHRPPNRPRLSATTLLGL